MVKCNDDLNRGQRSKTCDVTGCNEKGRVLARIGGKIEIAYCPKHRKKYGERIINALINSKFNYKLTNFLAGVKTKIFWEEGILDEGSAQRLKEYILKKTDELEELVEYAEDNEVTLDEEIE